MAASSEQINGLINNYKKALREYPLTENEKEECLKKIEELERLKEKLKNGS